MQLERLGCGCASAKTRKSIEAPTQYERHRPFKVEHIALDVTVNFDKKQVSGSARLDIKRVDSCSSRLDLDAIDFIISSVELESAAGRTQTEHRYDGNRIEIDIPDALSSFAVWVHYTAQPERGLYFLAPDVKVPGRPKQLYSQCQDEDARFWLPCSDKPNQKMTTELKVRVPKGMLALSNGELLSPRPVEAELSAAAPSKRSQANQAGSIRAAGAHSKQQQRQANGALSEFHFKLDKPHPSYLITLVVGEFEVRREQVQSIDGRQLDLVYYVPPGKSADGERAFRNTAQMLRLFEEKTQVPYPFSLYSQIVVSDFMFGGMENTTATTMGDDILLDARAAQDIESDDLVAHELAHQWFGDFVTCRDWSHAWLNEGFATFFELVEREGRLGRDEYDYALKTLLGNYLAESTKFQRPIVSRNYFAPIELFDRHLYEKGGLVLHLLCARLGEERFWSGVRSYLTSHAYNLVETNDLMRSLEEVSGLSLERFFDQWVYRPSHPQLKLRVTYQDRRLSVDLKQTPAGETKTLFELPLKVEVGYLGGKGSKPRVERHEMLISGAHGSLNLTLTEAPSWVEIDPNYELLGEVEIDCPTDMLIKQLKHGPRARARWVAAQLLGKRGGTLAISALGKSLANSTEAWMVRVEAAKALGRQSDERALAELLEHPAEEHPKVRRAVLAALGQFKDPRVLPLLTRHAQKDKSYLVQSEAAAALGRAAAGQSLLGLGPSKPEQILSTLKKVSTQNSWGDVVRAGAVRGIAQLGEEQGLPCLLETTQYGVPTRGRRAAILALAELGSSKQVRKHLEHLLADPHPHVRADVARALEALGDSGAIPALRSRLSREKDDRVRSLLKSAITQLNQSGNELSGRLTKELETLREKLEEVQSKLGKLEELNKPQATKGSSK